MPSSLSQRYRVRSGRRICGSNGLSNLRSGGVVSNTYFEAYFGIIVNGIKDVKKSNDISSNIVSILQAGAFFGALGSAPISGTWRMLHLCPGLKLCVQIIARIGRKYTLLIFSLVFAVGAVSTDHTVQLESLIIVIFRFSPRLRRDLGDWEKSMQDVLFQALVLEPSLQWHRPMYLNARRRKYGVGLLAYSKLW